MSRFDIMITVEELVAQLRTLGLRAGMTVIVHSSLRALSGNGRAWLAGGPQAVVEALQTVLTEAGTLVMPTHSTDLSEPSYWQHPPVPAAWWPVIRAQMPAYRPDLTPTRQMGLIVDTFRQQRGVTRSSHPAHSFAAWGRHAFEVTTEHSLDNSLGERSPLARVYDLDGAVLLLGVGHGNNTSLHLAEYRATWSAKQTVMEGSPIWVNGERKWVAYWMVDGTTDDFAALGAAFDISGGTQRGVVGAGIAQLMSQRALVDFAARWLATNRAEDPPLPHPGSYPSQMGRSAMPERAITLQRAMRYPEQQQSTS